MKALERVDVYITALLARYYGSIGFQPESESFGLMQVDVRSEPPSDQEIVSDRQTHRIQLPGLRYDFSFFPESSNFDSMLDAVLPADVPLCIAPRPGLYDLSSYEVCFHSQIALLTLTQECSASLSSSLRQHIVVASPKRMHIGREVQE